MIYAPICIITINRYQHLKNLLASLEENVYAKYTDIIIGVDYPPNEKYVEGYRKVCEYLEETRGRYCEKFKSFTVYKHDVNVGQLFNMHYIIDKAFEVCDRVIFFQDDNVASKDCIEFFDVCLEHYKDEKRVFSIGANNLYDIHTDNSNVFLLSKFDIQGAAFWKSKFYKAKSVVDREYIDSHIKDRGIWNKFERNWERKRYMDFLMSKDEIPFGWDVIFSLYMQIEGMYQLRPLLSKSLHKGYDGSGQFLNKNDKLQSVTFEENNERFFLRENDIYNRTKIVENNLRSDVTVIPFRKKCLFMLLHVFGAKPIRNIKYRYIALLQCLVKIKNELSGKNRK